MLAGVADLKERATEAFQSGDLLLFISITKNAIQLLGNALRDEVDGQRCAIAREQSRLHSNLAAALLELEDYDAAAEEARAAIKLDPSWHRPYLRLCMALTAMNSSPDAAVEALRSGLSSCQSPDQLRELQDSLSALLRHSPVDGASANVADSTARDAGKGAPLAACVAPPSRPRRGESHTAELGAKRRRHNDEGGIPFSPAAIPGAAPAPASGHNASDQPVIPRQPQPQQHRRLPVTALCGFLGSGKTTLVRHLLTCLGSVDGASRVGLIVNDLATTNIDGQLLALPPPLPAPQAPPAQPHPDLLYTEARPHSDGSSGGAVSGGAALPASGVETPSGAATPLVTGPDGGAAASVLSAAGAPAASGVRRQPAELRELSNGCVCCNLRGELQQQLRQLAARQPPLEHLIVECTGVGEPEALAAAVRALESEGLLELASVVTVVDAGAFLELMAAGGGGGGGADYANGEGEGRCWARAEPLQDGVGDRPEAGRPDEQRDGGPGSEAPVNVLMEAAPLADNVAGRKAAAKAVRAAAGVGDSAQGGAGSLRPLAQLLVQQVEAADVVLLNKCDRLMDRAQRQKRPQQAPAGAGPEGAEAAEAAEAEARALGELRRVRAVVRALNPSARVLPCVRCAVPLDAILQPPTPAPQVQSAVLQPLPPRNPPQSGTRQQSIQPLPLSAPLSLSLRGEVPAGTASGAVGGVPSPGGSGGRSGPTADVQDRANEQDEYGISSFVFRDQVPFHPARLWALLQSLAAAATTDKEVDEAVEVGPQGASVASAPAEERERSVSGGRTEGADEPMAPPQSEGGGRGGSEVGAAVVPELPFRPPPLLRAKGFFWVASLPQAMWELSLAGGQVEMEAVGRWLCTMVNPEDWPVGRHQPSTAGDQATSPAAPGNSSGADSGGSPRRPRWHRRWGDRCNELVFIGLGLGSPGQLGPERELGLGSVGLEDDERPVETATEMKMESEDPADRAEAPVEDAAGAAAACVASPAGSMPAAVAAAAGIPTPGEPVAAERLAALLRWAQLSAQEAAEGEDVWVTWDDAAWLALLEQY